ncbi:MAG: hypothetical protein JWM09_796 [Francisellaceae bacterium]|nr:hypothetical protein [Francisellaceae bacterium]
MLDKTPILKIENLNVTTDDKIILDNLNLTIYPGEVHAIMGPNGAGKSTLANYLAGHPDYVSKNGYVSYLGQSLEDLSIIERAVQGLFLSFQYPVSIPGLSNIQFLKASLNAIRTQQQLPPLDAVDFIKHVKEKMRSLDMDDAFLYRPINEGFSGGEKKRNEMLQMSLLEPKLAILDETDSGLDIDALKIVAQSINTLKNDKRAILLITHYNRLLDYVEPDYIHVLSKGKIVHSGDKSLSLELEEKGYTWLEENGSK